MESIIDILRIPSLRGQIEASRLYSVALANEFESATTSTEKTNLASQYDHALKQMHSMQLALEILERKQADPPAKSDS